MFFDTLWHLVSAFVHTLVHCPDDNLHLRSKLVAR